MESAFSTRDAEPAFIWLLDRGAEVVGVDVSREILDRANERVGDQAEFHRGDIAGDLEFATDDSFDGVVSTVALGYVKRWHDTVSEFARILEPGGCIVFSVLHPLDAFSRDGSPNYFEIEVRAKEWSVDVPYYLRPSSEIIDSLLETGYDKESRQPVFICVRAVNR